VFAVLSLRLPEGLDKAAAALSASARTAAFLEPFSAKWASLLVLLYCFLVLPLLLVATLLGAVAADFVAEPLVSLEEATRRVAGGDFGVRLIVKPGDETGRLVASFNRMLGEIERSRSDELRREKIDAWQDIAQRLAHELKNPLTPIRLAAERVLKRWRNDPALTAPIIEGSMLAIVKEVEGMDALLGDFRAFASLPEPQRDWTELSLLVADSVALYAASYPDVRFRLEALPAGLTLRVDRATMKRALGNLIANSIDAMEGRGEIEIAADLVKAADSRYCRLKIRDTGHGIPASLGEKVFMPYFTTKSAGTGLGLSIVERIVAEHGGAIRFESDEGSGTTFYVDLPLDR
jgi:nitrogen fixation/metabolism regulation signal transduction histidine kinase